MQLGRNLPGVRSMNKALRSILVLASLSSLFHVTAGNAVAASTLRGGGTGAAMVLLNRLGEAFSAQNPGVSIEVVVGLGTSGAIEALVDGALDFAVAARSLTPSEQAKSLAFAPFCRTPFGIVTSYATPSGFGRLDLTDFYADPTSRWPDGTAVKVILRPRSDSDTMMLAKLSPRMAEVLDNLRKRAEIPIAATDQDNGKLAASLQGSLATMTYTQALSENLDLRFLEIDGIVPSVENLERGRYSLERRFYFVSRADNRAEAFIAFVRSPEGEKILREAGNLPVMP
uniref:ABC-type phosphate transport system periplasmic component-like protein n=1 Tax=Rhodopseudomonas palustris (strain BisA53) TaxID=316055 RepID=Q07NU4_RHOP5